jgi:hypothetical protein
MTGQRLGLRAKLLLAALQCSGGETDKQFTLEDLLVAAWQQDHKAWGLRGYETKFPDLERIHREVDSRGKSAGSRGLINDGYLKKVVGQRIYTLTSKGLATAGQLSPHDATVQTKVKRDFQEKIRYILENPVFHSWLKNHEQPKYFRDAGNFWRIAPGSPAETVRIRVRTVEEVIQAAIDFLVARGEDEVADSRGRVLFSKLDLDRCMEFQRTLKDRFARELAVLDGS